MTTYPMMNIRFNFLVFLCSTMPFFGQEHRVEGQVTAYTSDGLHQLKIPHEVRSYARRDLSDFRILDSKGDQVPYYKVTTSKELRVSDFSVFEIVSKSRIPDTSSTYVFKNSKGKINQVVLEIANYLGNKQFSMQGSRDQKKWFGLVNKEQLDHLNSPSKTSIYKAIDFPWSRYRYIKITFDDRNSLPINLLQVGAATTKIVAPPPSEVITPQSVKYSTLKEENKTVIQVNFAHPEIIDRLQFHIAAPAFYRRRAQVYVLKTRKVKQRTQMYKKRIASFMIDSNKPTTFEILRLRQKEVYVAIENEDNPPLTITSLTLSQSPIHVVAALKQQEHYTITAGDERLKAPSYDISYFKNSTKTLSNATITAIHYPKTATHAEEGYPSFWQQSWFLWVCIGIAAVLIAYFASGLIKDLKQE